MFFFKYVRNLGMHRYGTSVIFWIFLEFFMDNAITYIILCQKVKGKKETPRQSIYISHNFNVNFFLISVGIWILIMPHTFVARGTTKQNWPCRQEGRGGILSPLSITASEADHGYLWAHAHGNCRIVLSSECITPPPDVAWVPILKDVVSCLHVPQRMHVIAFMLPGW